MRKPAILPLGKILQKYWTFSVPLSFFLLLFIFLPFRQAFWMDSDEGINLMKAQMLLRGYSLYSEIWSDQPPLLTYLLAGLFSLLGARENAGRILVLIFSSGLVWAAVEYLRRVWGWQHALLGAVLFLMLPEYIHLSVSVMVGLPAIAIALVALWAQVRWHQERKPRWLAASAVLLALAVLTKIFTGLLVPIFSVGLLLGEFERFRSHRRLVELLSPAVLWSLGFSLVLAAGLWLFVGPAHFNQLFGNHLQALAVQAFQDNPELHLSAVLQDAAPFLWLGMAGIVVGLLKRRWLNLYPALWMVLAYTSLYRHVPVWNHQQLLISVPALLLAAGAAGEALANLTGWLRQRTKPTWHVVLHLASLGLLLWLVLLRGPQTISQFDFSPDFSTPQFLATTTEAKLLKIVRKYAPQTRWMVTDQPIYAFYAGLPVPPNLVVFSSKRVETGNLTEADLLATLQQYQPEQVLLGRNALPVIQKFLQDGYSLVEQRGQIQLYVRNSIIPAE